MTDLTVAVPAANGQGAAQTGEPGWYTVACYAPATGGDWDSGTVTLQVNYAPSDPVWITAVDWQGDNVAFAAANGIQQIAYGGTPQFRASLAGSSGATVVTCKLFRGKAMTREEDWY